MTKKSHLAQTGGGRGCRWGRLCFYFSRLADCSGVMIDGINVSTGHLARRICISNGFKNGTFYFENTDYKAVVVIG